MIITFITSNSNKAKEMKMVLEPEIGVEQGEVPYQEVHASTIEEVAKHAAQELANKLQKPVVVDDSGLFIQAYDGYPGPYTKVAFEKVGCRGFLKLMNGVADRTIFYRCAIAYCKPGDIPHMFVGEEEGIMAEEERGALGWGQDPIFIPRENNPEQKTYGEARKPGENLFRQRACMRLKEFLLSK